jgi:hypothetical protein
MAQETEFPTDANQISPPSITGRDEASEKPDAVEPRSQGHSHNHRSNPHQASPYSRGKPFSSGKPSGGGWPVVGWPDPPGNEQGGDNTGLPDV